MTSSKTLSQVQENCGSSEWRRRKGNICVVDNKNCVWNSVRCWSISFTIAPVWRKLSAYICSKSFTDLWIAECRECAAATMNYKFITVISKNVSVLILGRVIQHEKYFEFFITQNEFLIKRYIRPYKVMKISRRGEQIPCTEVAQATKCCKMAPKIFGYSVRSLLHVTIWRRKFWDNS